MEIKDVENLALLARLELTDEEKKKILSDMGNILQYVNEIEEVKIPEIKSTSGVYNVWREDEESVRDFSRDLILEQFPSSQDQFLKVKKIL